MPSARATRFVSTLTAELENLRDEQHIRRFAAGQVIFSAGDAGDGFYVIDSGEVRISITTGPGEQRELARIGAGDFFGEMAVIDAKPRSANAIAETPTKTYFLTRDTLMTLLPERPQLALDLVREISTRMRTLNQKYLDEILQAERLAVIGRFAGTIVHDFKNPLTIINLAVELACSEDSGPEMRLDAQAKVSRQIERMTNMLQELIEFTRPSGQQPNLGAGDFAEFMTPLLEEIRQEAAVRSVKLIVENPPPHVAVELEPRRLSRLFYNLVNNAVDEMARGGKIFLRFKVVKHQLHVEVEDTGKGIAPEIAASLFMPFATHGKKHGTGLGLTICRKIVEDHRGQIWATSERGKGATFTFTLPLIPQMPGDDLD